MSTALPAIDCFELFLQENAEEWFCYTLPAQAKLYTIWLACIILHNNLVFFVKQLCKGHSK